MSANSAVEYFVTVNSRALATLIAALGSTKTVDKLPLATQVVPPALGYQILDDFTQDVSVISGVVIITRYIVEILAIDDSNSDNLRTIEDEIGNNFHLLFNVNPITPYGTIDTCTRLQPINRIFTDRDNREWEMKGYQFELLVRES